MAPIVVVPSASVILTLLIPWLLPVLYAACPSLSDSPIEKVPILGSGEQCNVLHLLTLERFGIVDEPDPAQRRTIYSRCAVYIEFPRFHSCDDIAHGHDCQCPGFIVWYWTNVVSTSGSRWWRLFATQDSSVTVLTSPIPSSLSVAASSFRVRPVVGAQFSSPDIDKRLLFLCQYLPRRRLMLRPPILECAIYPLGDLFDEKVFEHLLGVYGSASKHHYL